MAPSTPQQPVSLIHSASATVMIAAVVVLCPGGYGVHILHDHPSYLCWPDVLSMVGDPLTGRRVLFTESLIVLITSFLLLVLFTQFILDTK